MVTCKEAIRDNSIAKQGNTLTTEDDELFESNPLDWKEYVGQVRQPSIKGNNPVWQNICECDDFETAEKAILEYEAERTTTVRVVEINNHVVTETKVYGKRNSDVARLEK